jgi:hypothetical protein
VRAFIARESELIAGSLLEASRALAPLPPTSALAAVLERMRSLRGLGAAGELSPLPELLDAMEATTRSLLSDPAPPPGVAGVFADAADALVAMARSVAHDGRVLVPTGLDQGAPRLLETFTGEHDVVPIAELGYDGEPVMLERGTPQAEMPAGDPLPIELVGVGDHLQIQAEALDHQESAAARDLRLFVLHRTLATMPTQTGTGRFVAPLARAISRAIGGGMATTDPDRFTTMLREAGQFLVEAGDTSDARAFTDRRDMLAREIGGDAELTVAADTAMQPIVAIESLLPGATVEDEIVAIASLAPDDAEADVVEIASLAPDDAEAAIVSIESLAPDDDSDIVEIATLAPDELDVVDIATLAPDEPATVGAPRRLERGYRRREALIRQGGLGTPSLAALGGDGVMPVEELLYRGERALARAEELRAHLSAILAEPTVSLDRLRPLLDELFDLMPLARDAA